MISCKITFPMNTCCANSFVMILIPEAKLCRSVYNIVIDLISIKRQFKVISRTIQLK
ncbi:hypothetical protein Hanom_Chr01g00068171 [Helianthus anomalus]